ncbi:MAG: hypothetical protein ACREI9_05665 [Nitrospiraceae bacterium]
MAQKGGGQMVTVREGSTIDIQAKAVCMALCISTLNTKRKVDSGSVQVDADEDRIHVAKEILDSETLKEIGRLDKSAREYLYKRCLPSPFKRGVYLHPIALLQETMKWMEDYEAERETLKKKFYSEYPKLCDKAKKALRDLWDEDDYPSLDRVKAAFGVEIQLLQLEAPDALKAISGDLYRREVVKVERMWEKAGSEIVAVLTKELSELVAHMADRLESDAKGERKTFRDTVVTNFTDWLSMFEARNLTGDQELKTVVDRAKKMIAGITPDVLRESDVQRETVAKGFATLKKVLDENLVDRKKRKIRFDEE